MAKSKNQNFFSNIVHGNESAGGTLRLQSTSHPTLGPVEVAGSFVDVIIGGITGRISHGNATMRQYVLPDLNGTLLASGIFTAPNQLLYSSSASTYAVLSPVNGSLLASTAAGVPQWISGTEGQIIAIVGGFPAFITDSTGVIQPSAGNNTLAVYTGAGSTLAPLPTVALRALLSTSAGVLNWSRITAQYLAGSTGALANGTAGQRLASLGDGGFQWVDDPSLINVGAINAMPFYSVGPTGQVLSASAFISVDETNRALELRNFGKLRFYKLTSEGSNYVELRVPPTFATGSIVFELPTQDGPAGSSLVTNGTGGLSFQLQDNGSIANGIAQQLAFYSAAGNDVGPFATSADRVLLSPAGTLTWSLVAARYLSGPSGNPLTNGTLNQVLTSLGNGNLQWTNVTDLSGTVQSGTAFSVAYYPVNGASVQASSFLQIDDTNRIVSIANQGVLRLFEQTANGLASVSFRAPAQLTVSTAYTLPVQDGSSEQVLSTDSSGILSWITVGRGTVNSGAANTLAYYAGAGATVNSLVSSASSVLTTTAGNTLQWSLIGGEHLRTTGGLPLGYGTAGYVMSTNGTDSLLWVDPVNITGRVLSGTQNRLAYYISNTAVVDDSGFIETEESSRVLRLLLGKIAFVEGANSISFGAPTLTSSTSYTLPATDAAIASSALTSNAAGILSWSELVAPGLVDSLAFYASTASRVEPAANVKYSTSALTLLGSTFTVSGQSSATPTSVTLAAGSFPLGTGATLTLQSGAGTTAGPLRLMTGSQETARLEDTGLFVRLGKALKFFDTANTHSVSFSAPASLAASIAYTLPAADATVLGQVLSSNAAGVLTWVNPGKGTITDGAIGSIPFYSAIDTLSASIILAPTVAAATAGEALVVTNITTGQLGFQSLVQTGGTVGNVAFYKAGQTVGWDAGLSFNATDKALELAGGSALRMFPAAGATYAGFTAPSAVATSYTVSLPAAAPEPGFVLSAVSSTSLTYAAPGSQSRFEQRGSLPIGQGIDDITIVFDSEFETAPAVINATWSIEGSTELASMPNFAVRLVTRQGFRIELSEQVPDNVGGSYRLYWTATLQGSTTISAKAHFAGGTSTANGPGTFITALSMDLDTSTVTGTSLLTPVGSAAGVASAAKGFTLGGIDAVSSVNTVQSLAFSTGTAAVETSVLLTARFGAASAQTKGFGFVLGGQGAAPLLSIEKLNFATLSFSVLSATLSTTTLRRGFAQNVADAYVVHSNATSTAEVFSKAAETLTALSSNFGVPNVSVGCNSTQDAYFATDSGSIRKLSFATTTITTVAATLGGTVRSGSANSLRKGYFVSASSISSLDFSTDTSTFSVNSLDQTDYESASVSHFHTRGLL